MVSICPTCKTPGRCWPSCAEGPVRRAAGMMNSVCFADASHPEPIRATGRDVPFSRSSELLQEFLQEKHIQGAVGAELLNPGGARNHEALRLAIQRRQHHLFSIQVDGGEMAESVRQVRSRPPDSEKITINLGFVDLGSIDLLVAEGFYSNRTDFIRTAIRNQLERHADVTRQSVARKSLDLGLRRYSRDDLEAARAAGKMLHIHVVGLVSIASDVSPELARATIASLEVLGALQAGPEVKAALSDRIR